jgi:hypothetical protein
VYLHGFGETSPCSFPVPDRLNTDLRNAAERIDGRRRAMASREIALELLVMSALSAVAGFDASHHHLRRR